jgi:DNA-directed RNA polymerase specialized sigma24 family protein
LAKAIARNPTVTERYLRRVIVNAMHDEFRAKRVIDDPVLINREDEDEEEGLGEPEAVDEMPLASESFFDAQYVREWASALSIREQCIADLLWVRGASERDAAAELGISKTRLHQLKDDLARRARIDLVALAA